MSLRIRPYNTDDRDAVGRICVLTGDSGKDATGKHASDELLPAIYAYPYVDYAPDLAWVVEDTGSGRVLGYIIGVEDIRDYVQWRTKNWLPSYRELLPVDESWSEDDLRLRARGEDPEAAVHPLVERYPAEFHIDLLPEAQGGGMGRKLVTTFAQALADRGVDALAIGVGAKNTGAVAFYKRLGFQVLNADKQDAEPTGYLMGLDIPTFLAGSTPQ